MSISVLIPTFNSSRTIQYTIESVLNQTLSPYEIIVLDDGSTDDTIDILNGYKSSVKILQQANAGVANARNILALNAQGDLLAFLDHDDVWHPSYLEVQQYLFSKYNGSVAFFTGHLNFYGELDYKWDHAAPVNCDHSELMKPIDFLRAYTFQTGSFASMSFCCIPRNVLSAIGREPFCTKVSGADDFYLFNMLPLLGTVVYTPMRLVAYRITERAQSHDRLRGVELAVRSFEHLVEYYSHEPTSELGKLFHVAFAIKRRFYAKLLMGAGLKSEARRQLLLSLRISWNFLSLTKSLAMLLWTSLPPTLQPAWPSGSREVEPRASVFCREVQDGGADAGKPD